MKDSRITQYPLRLLGLVFILSGIFKFIGLHSFEDILGKYCSFLGYDFLIGRTYPLALFICVAEILLGIASFLRGLQKYVVWIFPVIMGFFTYITCLNYITLYGQIESCGCMGEVVHFTPFSSFCKNVILAIVSLIPLIRRCRNLK